MYPISFAIKLGIQFYHIPVIVYDTAYVKDETTGIDERILIDTRTIKAAVDPTRSKDLERIFGGSIGDGDIAIYCDGDILYIDDVYSESSRGMQSFVGYQGYKFRVAQDADWTPQADVRVYLAKRHLDQDSLFDTEDSGS